MPARVVYSPLSLSDLNDIWSFLAVECNNSNAADKTVSNILDSLGRLSDLPESGTPLDSRCIVYSDYRFVVSGSYLSFYRYEGGTVYIDRILDGRSDYLRTLFGTSGPAIGMCV